jgi:phage terminase large subunit-like protein
MVEGPSGILAVARAGEVESWSFTRRTLRFAGGAEAVLFSGAHTEGLRGPEHDFAWCDELAKWRRAGESWDNLQLGLRRGERPRRLIEESRADPHPPVAGAMGPSLSLAGRGACRVVIGTRWCGR